MTESHESPDDGPEVARLVKEAIRLKSFRSKPESGDPKRRRGFFIEGLRHDPVNGFYVYPLSDRRPGVACLVLHQDLEVPLLEREKWEENQDSNQTQVRDLVMHQFGRVRVAQVPALTERIWEVLNPLKA